MSNRRLIHMAASIQPSAYLVRTLYERQFRSSTSLGRFRGVYPDFATAIASAPSGRPTGYDHEAAGQMYSDRPVFPEDYAVLFWLTPLLQRGLSVLDFGGHAGGMIDAFRILPSWPKDVSWTIYDVEAAVRHGIDLNASRPKPQPNFVTQLEDADSAEVLLASGSLQYCDTSLPEILGELRSMPSHIIINQIPLHETDEFVTLQNIGTAYCAYWIRNRGRFMKSLMQAGYELVDMWENPGKNCFIPTYPRQTRPVYFGAYLRRTM